MWIYVPESLVCRCSQESEESTSASREQSADIELWATSSGRPIARPSSWRGWKNRSWSGRLFTEALKRLTPCPSAISRSCTGGSPVRISATPASEQGSVESGADCGPSSQESLPFADATPSSKTWLHYERAALMSSFTTLPRGASIRSNMMFSRPKRQARRTAAKGSSFSRNEYPTPSATRYGTSQNEGKVAHKRPTAGTPSLETWANNWHTPLAGDAQGAGPNQRTQSLGKDVKNWATPGANDMIRTSDSAGRQGRKTTKDGDTTSQRAVLNPQFVEALMGFPTGWSSAPIG